MVNGRYRGVIIAGGFGTRLRPLTLTQPKPLMPLANRPFLEYQVGLLRSAGITEIVFATNYLAHQIEAHFGDGSRFGVHMIYKEETEPMDTGGAVRNAIEGLPTMDCVVFNGDVLHDFDLPAILRDHEESDAAATLTLYTVQRPHPYGVVPTDERRRVLAFLEPTQEQKKAADRGEKQEGTDNINAGLYVFRGEVAESIPLRRCNIEREFFPSLIASGALVLGHITGGYWTDVGRPAQLLAATRAILSGAVTVALPPAGEKRDGVYAGEGAEWVGATVTPGCAIGPKCMVAEGATVDDYSALGEDCRVESGARVSASVLLPGVTVGQDAIVEGCLIDRSCKIGEAAHLRNVVLGAGSVVTAHSNLGEGIR
ncbi:MAG: GDP-mannose pyrophosphorylase [Fimbriimonadales bacterium]